MPPKSSKSINTEPCDVCGVVVRYKADVPRHKRLHFAEKELMMYKCPVDGCDYQNLQRSNLNTHMSIHTGQKSHACPDCEYSTGDPGSLTRHRKKIHSYIPASSTKLRVTSNKQSPRQTPYQYNGIPPSRWHSSPLEELSGNPPALPSTSTTSTPPAAGTAYADNSYSYPWYKDLLLAEESTSNACSPFVPESLMGSLSYTLPPALDACQQLRSVDESYHDLDSGTDSFF